MSRYSKWFASVVLLLLAGSAAAQVTGTVKFYPSGGPSRKAVQSNSFIQLDDHYFSCAQDPVWKPTEVRGNTATNTSLFGPCVLDGVHVHHVVLYQTNSGLLLVLNMMDNTSWSFLLVNSAGVRLTDVIDVGNRGQYAAPKFVGFALFGAQNSTWR